MTSHTKSAILGLMSDPSPSTHVTITQSEYQSLLAEVRWLRTLEAAGVDNWDGYDIARDMLRAESETTLPHAYD